MKRRILTVLLSAFVLFTFAFGFTACEDGKDGKDGINGVDGTDGKDGVSVADSYIDENGCLILVLTDGKQINCGKVKADGTEGLLYSEIEKDGEVTGYCVRSIGTAGSNIVIPSKFDGKPVLEIGERAFSGCSNLIGITIPDSIVKIGKYAFYNCENLKSVTVGGGVKEIGGTAFGKCENLESVNVTDLSVWCEISFDNLSSNPLYFAKDLYINSVLADEIVIPDSAACISDFAFYECENITSLNAGTGVKSIGERAFYNCENLKSVTAGGNVTSIGESAFFNCCNLENLVLGGKVKTIEGFAFSQCEALPEVRFPSSVQSIGESAFSECSALESAALNYGLKTIGDGAFAGCVALQKLIIPDSVTEIGWGVAMFETGGAGFGGVSVFSNCLTELVISNSLKEIPDFAFSKSNISSAVIGNSVEVIKYSSFYGCEMLESLVVPKSVKQIESYAFYKCLSLDAVYYEGTAAEWSKITIGRNGNDISNSTKYYYCATQPAAEGNFWHYVDNKPTKW